MYFKITNQEECHNGYQYHTGLNILDRPFEKEGSCVKGGLYFTTLEYLDQFYDYGVWIREIQIPEDAEVVIDPTRNKWRSNQIILGNKYPLFDIKIIKKFNLEINKSYINLAFAHGHVEILEWWLKARDESKLKDSDQDGSRLGGDYTDVDGRAVELASQNGHVAVLDWWLKTRKIHPELKLEYWTEAIDKASKNCRIEVLNWWLKAKNEDGLKLHYTNWAINWASISGHTEVLDWWLKAKEENGLELKYTRIAIDQASYDGQLEVLDWWLKTHKSTGLELKYTSEAIHHAIVRNSVAVLEWWKNSGLKLKYTNRDYLTNDNNMDALEWWAKFKSELESKSS